MSPLWIALLIAALLALPGEASAQVLYKWIDKDGKTQYSDQAPKNFSGPVTRIQPDEVATPAAAPRTDAGTSAKAQKANDDTRAIIDMAQKKRALRNQLEARVKAARENLETAKNALANASPADDERQVIQQRIDQTTPNPGPGSASNGGMLGMNSSVGTARSNCVTGKNLSGNVVTMCPTAIPNDAYYDRLKQLEDNVKAAEDALAEAETAYRRGVD